MYDGRNRIRQVLATLPIRERGHHRQGNSGPDRGRARAATTTTSLMISENTTVISPSNLTPNHPDLLDFSIARSLRSASCDIKSTGAPQEAKTCDASKLNLSIHAHPTTDLPLIAVENGHASEVVQKDEAWHLTSTGNRRRSYAGRPISYTISDADRAEAYSRWRHAERRRTPFTRFVTLKPPTDHLDPVERIALWDKVRQRYRCFCQDCEIECVMMTTRESNPKDSKGEHLHLLIAIPPEHQATFDRLAPRWFPNTDVRPTNHDERITSSGKVKSGFGYCHKAVTPQAARRNRSIWYRRSGAILGERSWSTRNLHQKARGQHDLAVRAAVRLHRERISIEPAVAAQLQAASASVAVLPAGIV